MLYKDEVYEIINYNLSCKVSYKHLIIFTKACQEVVRQELSSKNLLCQNTYKLFLISKIVDWKNKQSNNKQSILYQIFSIEKL